jgi:hypothetical protein
MSRSKFLAAASCAILGCTLANTAGAALVVVDFNDLAQGNLAGQLGGTGMSSSAWAGATNPQVIAGDLTAPASTHYAVPQSAGTAQSLRTTSTTSAAGTGQDTRTTASTLGGTVWFSFLANPNDSNARAGISFNTSGPSASGARMDFTTGGALFVSYGAGGNAGTAQTVGVTHLVVGQIIVDESGAFDHLRLWVDPDVNTLTQDTTANRVFDAVSADWVGSGITSVAVQSYTGGTTAGGTVDAVRVSNNPTAQADVTGVTPVPEPASLALATIAAGALLARRRRG